MSFRILTTPHFDRAAKALSKRYRSIKCYLKDFIDSLQTNPLQGDELTPGIRKIRMAISSKGRAKSGGTKVITYTIIVTENEGDIYLIDIYDKADYSTVDVSIIRAIIDDLNL